MSEDQPRINMDELVQKQRALQNLTFKDLTKLAKQGDMHAQNLLAHYYKVGYCCDKDYKMVVHWYTKAAKQGHPVAQNNLGFCYLGGDGVKKDDEMAVYWLKKAAEQGIADSENNLGDCYCNGIGVERDGKRAVYWYQKAAEQGNPRAQANLGACYSKGLGVTRDYEMAICWYKKAAKQEGVPKHDDEKTMVWWSCAARLGDSEAQLELVKCYYEGIGVPKNRMLLKHWLQKAIEQDNKEALEFLAEHPDINLSDEDTATEMVVEASIISQPSIATKGEIIYCMECGAKLPADAKFCYKCGKKVIHG